MRKKVLYKEAKNLSQKSKNNQKKVKRLVKKYQQQLRIKDYTYKYRFVNGKGTENFYAEIFIVGKKVVIYFNQDLLDKQAKSIEDTVIHELLHVVLYKLVDKTTKLINRYVRRKSVRDKVENKLIDLEHETIERIAPSVFKKQ